MWCGLQALQDIFVHANVDILDRYVQLRTGLAFSKAARHVVAAAAASYYKLPLRCRFLRALRFFPRLRSVALAETSEEGHTDLSYGSEIATQLPELEQLWLMELSLLLEEAGGGPACTALSELTVTAAERVSIATSLPQLQELTVHDTDHVQLAEAGLQLPALGRLDIEVSEGGTLEVDFGAMPAL